MLVTIDAPHFNAGIIIGENDVVKWTAPILKYMKGWHYVKVRRYCERKQWQILEH